MTNSIAKRALTVAVAAATILWSVGFATLVPQSASAASFGDLIKGTTLSTVYYYGSDGQRYSFPNEKTFFSWYNDFSGVVTMSDAELANITLAGNVVYRPGSRWIKITSDEKTYAVAKGGTIHWIESEAVAVGLAGSDWNQFIDDVPDVFFVDYTVGNSLTSATDAYEGALVKSGSDTWLSWGGKKLKVTAEGMTANMFKSGFVLDGSGATLAGLTAGADVTSKQSNLTDAAQKVTTTTYETTQNVTVSLSASTPAASTIIAAQGLAHLMSLEFMNPTSSAVSVKSLKLSRTGVSSDTTLSSVYLFDGYKRLTDSATVSSGSISWSDSSGLFSIPAGGTATVAVRSHILTGTGGQTVGVKLAAAGDVTFKGSFAASGSMPVSSPLHTVATAPSNFATFSFAATTTPTANTALDPQDDYRLWENTVTVGNNEVDLFALRFRNVGSVDAKDVQNWTLYVAGTQRGDVVAQQDSNGYLTFDLSKNPVKMNTGSHVVKVLADIIGGSTRTVTLGLRDTADAVVMDEDFDQPLLVQADSAAFSARNAGAQTISSGEVTFTKKTNSASGDVIDGASNLSLASFEVKASGEAMKIENLNFNIAEDDADTAYSLRNGAVYVEGSQVGSTTRICSDDTTTSGVCTGVAGSGASYTQFTFGSSFIAYPGSPLTMEVKADIFDNDGTDGVTSADTIRLVIDSASASSNVLGKVSGTYVSRPTADVAGNTLTVRVGALTTANNTSYSAQSAVAPKTAYKVGAWTVTSTTVETVNLTQFDVDFSAAASDASAAADYSNLYVKYGPTGTENTASTKTSVSLSTNTWSINYALKPGETIYVNAYADVATSVTDDNDADDIITADLDVDGTAASSATSLDGSDVSASAVTWYTSGTFTSATDGSTAVARSIAAGQTVEATKFRFTSVRESYSIDQIQVDVGSAAAAGVISKVELYDGSTLLGSSVFNTSSNASVTNGAALVTGLNIAVSAGTYKVITAKLVLNDIGAGQASSQQNLALDLDAFRYSDSQGTVTTDSATGDSASTTAGGTDASGNEIRTYNSIPVLKHVDLTNSTLVNGQSMDLYKFSVTANSNGPIALKQVQFQVSITDDGTDTADLLEMESWKLYKNGTDVSTSSTAVLIQDEDGADIEDTTGIAEANGSNAAIYIIWDTGEEVIGAGETATYTLRATPQSFDLDGDTGDEDYFTMFLEGDTAHNGTDICLEDSGAGDIWELDGQVSSACTAASSSNSAYNFIWSDNSGESHDGALETGSGDWADGYLLLDLDLAGETWAK